MRCGPPAEPFGGKEAIKHRDCELGFAGPRRHGEKHLAAIGLQGFFNFLNGALLIRA
jgi:hypothetical protein